jgi:Zn-dependent protease with chaperone function
VTVEKFSGIRVKTGKPGADSVVTYGAQSAMLTTAGRAGIGFAAVVMWSAQAAGELAPMVLASAATEAVVVVQSVKRDTMTMEIESARGKRVTVKVAPGSLDFDRIESGSRFCVRLRQSVALFVGMPGESLSLASAWTARFADKGARPQAVLLNNQEIRARVGATREGERTLVLIGPDGHSSMLLLDPRMDASGLSAGDMVVVRYSESLEVSLGEADAACAYERLPSSLETPPYRDAHGVESIRAALSAPIPDGLLQQADRFDEELIRTQQVNARPVSLVSDDRRSRANRVADALLAAYREDRSAWTVRVLDSSPLRDYAFVVGGRRIYVFTGLVDRAESDDELAFVLAHEIAHSRLKHVVRRRETFPWWLNTIMDVEDLLVRQDATKDYLDLVAGAVRSLASRVDEQEADALAAYITTRAGFDSLQGAAVFTRLIERDGATNRAHPRSALLAAHPANEDRKVALLASVDYLRGMRSLESLSSLGQGYKVFSALELLERDPTAELTGVSRR